MAHIQKMAPGPPLRMAVATPTMLPVPMVAASAVHRLWNWLMALSFFSVWAVMSRSVKMAPMVFRSQYRKCPNWKKPVRTDITKPVPNSSASPTGPQTMPLTTPFTLVMVSNMIVPPSAKQKADRTPKALPAKRSFPHRGLLLTDTPLCAQQTAAPPSSLILFPCDAQFRLSVRDRRTVS